MTIGVGGENLETALAQLQVMTGNAKPIAESEFRGRISTAQQLMREAGIEAMYLHAGTNLYYFTGLRWNPSERMVAAIVPAEGPVCYIAPRFELDTLRDYWLIEGDIHAWEEHDNPCELVHQVLNSMEIAGGIVVLDESTPFFIVSGLQGVSAGKVDFANAQRITQACRCQKSAAEIELIQQAHQMTLIVHQAAASILHEGIATNEVVAFIDEAHQIVGADAGSYFCIVLFGVATSFPHGVKHPQVLGKNDWVLIDTGCHLQGYNSDITRTFIFGEPDSQQRTAWDLEKQAQIAAFNACQIGLPCEVGDQAAREVLQEAGYGPDYQLPGLPHRTGHGCGLDIHESPCLVRGEKTLLAPGMVFSSEPMLVVPDRFGCRLEDHFYMTQSGPQWITQPCRSINDPFSLDV